MGGVAVIGCGFVADLYMRGLATYPGVRVLGAWDRDPAALARFRAHWGVTAFESLDAALAAMGPGDLALNLTNPGDHMAVSRACLLAGRHVWSEKPMALSMADARALHDLADARGLTLASAPSSVLSEAAQTLGRALREDRAGTPRVVYAELDDGFVPQAPVEAWVSESGAPWPWDDEFATGCTLEHAGYWLSWLIAFLGPVTAVTSATAVAIPEKRGRAYAAPDLSVAVLRFASGPVARLTCSVVAPHDHRLRVVGDGGVLEVARAWDNAAPVRLKPRVRVRRRLVDLPWGRRLSLRGPTHPHVARAGAARMNFALGPVEALDAIAAGRPARLGGAFALHLTEVTLAVAAGGVTSMETTCAPLEPMPWAA